MKEEKLNNFSSRECNKKQQKGKLCSSLNNNLHNQKAKIEGQQGSIQRKTLEKCLMKEKQNMITNLKP
jgi:hypothetical protein